MKNPRPVVDQNPAVPEEAHLKEFHFAPGEVEWTERPPEEEICKKRIPSPREELQVRNQQRKKLVK